VKTIHRFQEKKGPLDDRHLKLVVMNSLVLRAVYLFHCYRTELLLSLAITVHLKEGPRQYWKAVEYVRNANFLQTVMKEKCLVSMQLH